MQNHTFLLPVLGVNSADITLAMLHITHAKFERLRRGPALVRVRAAWGPVHEVTFNDGWATFFRVEEGAIDPETYEHLYDGSNVRLGAVQPDFEYTVVETLHGTTHLTSDGVYWAASAYGPAGGRLTTAVLTWRELGVEGDDDVRCQYEDCDEQHPIAGALELVTCRTCRK